MSLVKDRRSFLKKTLLGLGAGLSASTVGRAAEMCLATPDQTQGPFYPLDGVPDRLDLTKIPGRPMAEGLPINIGGRVLDENCEPIENAVVEIWQACASGKYSHPGDPNPAPLDPNFLYSGRVMTKGLGLYQFKTIKPGAYPASKDWVRPPHIHFKITAFGYETLVTQMYFADEEELNGKDLILRSLSFDERQLVVCNYVKTFEGLLVNFDITLKNPAKAASQYSIHL